MLTKRTNILFEKTNWDYLVALAKRNNTSVGELIRNAVVTVYLKNEDQITSDRSAMFDNIKKVRKELNYQFSTAEIKKLIDYGRNN